MSSSNNLSPLNRLTCLSQDINTRDPRAYTENIMMAPLVLFRNTNVTHLIHITMLRGINCPTSPKIYLLGFVIENVAKKIKI